MTRVCHGRDRFGCATTMLLAMALCRGSLCGIWNAASPIRADALVAQDVGADARLRRSVADVLKNSAGSGTYGESLADLDIDQFGERDVAVPSFDRKATPATESEGRVGGPPATVLAIRLRAADRSVVVGRWSRACRFRSRAQQVRSGCSEMNRESAVS